MAYFLTSLLLSFFHLYFFTSLLPDNVFVMQKEWMTTVMCKIYSMKVKDFGNHIKTLNCILTLMLHDEHVSMFTDTGLKALLLKSMPLSWQNAYLLKGIRASQNFCPMLSYFVQSQSIGESQVASKPFLSTATIHWGGRGGGTGCGPFGQHFIHFCGNQNTCIHCILAFVVFIWIIMDLVLFILLSPILGVIALTILKTSLQLARVLEIRKEVGKLDMVCIIIIKEDGEEDVDFSIFVS